MTKAIGNKLLNNNNPFAIISKAMNHRVATPPEPLSTLQQVISKTDLTDIKTKNVIRKNRDLKKGQLIS